jgi:hypothetical protein
MVDFSSVPAAAALDAPAAAGDALAAPDELGDELLPQAATSTSAAAARPATASHRIRIVFLPVVINNGPYPDNALARSFVHTGWRNGPGPPGFAKEESEMTAQPGGPSRAHLRDTRYGEVFLIRSEGNQLAAAVYNTTGLNDCPPVTWRSLNPQELASQFGVAAVLLNGPRFWTMDRITAHAVGEILSFGGLEARWVAELPIPPELDAPDRPAARSYRDLAIKRETEWHFAAGRPVYELLTPDGKTYVMQAYSHIVDDSLTMQSLPALGDRLQIPAGWQYRARTPDRELTLATTGGQAHILQDELQNTYMQLVA